MTYHLFRPFLKHVLIVGINIKQEKNLKRNKIVPIVLPKERFYGVFT